MTLKEYVLTIEDANGFRRDVKVIAPSGSAAAHSMAYGNHFQYNGGVVVEVKENLTRPIDTNTRC